MKTIASAFAGSILALSALSIANPAGAQSALVPAPHNVLQLQASGTVEVQQDLLVLTLAAVKDGKDAESVQTQLKQALDAALQAVRPSAAAQKMEVRTGAFSLSPRYGDKQNITAWLDGFGTLMRLA